MTETPENENDVQDDERDDINPEDVDLQDDAKEDITPDLELGELQDDDKDFDGRQ